MKIKFIQANDLTKDLQADLKEEWKKNEQFYASQGFMVINPWLRLLNQPITAITKVDLFSTQKKLAL